MNKGYTSLANEKKLVLRKAPEIFFAELFLVMNIKKAKTTG